MEKENKTLAEIFASSKEFTSVCTKLYTIPFPNEIAHNRQGGYSTEKYHYQIFMYRDDSTDQEYNIAYLVKFDLESGKIAKISKPMFTNHSNDIAYQPYRNELVVVHNKPNKSTLSLVDPETLDVKGTVKLLDANGEPLNIYCMDYSPSHHRFVVGLSGGQRFMFLNDDFKPVSEIFEPTPLTKGYVTQGCCCDDRFLYFALFNPSAITVYDWSGNYVGRIMTDIPDFESENLSIIRGKIYLAGGGDFNDGVDTYIVDPIPVMKEGD